MLGAIIGDIAGSRFEWNNIKSKDFELLTAIGHCRPTDDSIMSLAVAKAILNCNGDYTRLDKQAVSCMSLAGNTPTPGTAGSSIDGSMQTILTPTTASAMGRPCV